MRQIVQDLRAGAIELAHVPAPSASPAGGILAETRLSLVSPGTERMLVEFSQASLLDKARQQPERVRQVLDKIRADGVLPTLEAVFRKLDQPLPLGYCNVGRVTENAECRRSACGGRNADLRAGDRVVSNGPHAERVVVPAYMCAKIPDAVSDEHAAFTVLASVGLQGMRLAGAAAGERIVVYGLGLVGLLTAQMLQATGCEVLGIEINEHRLKLAEKLGVHTVKSGLGDPIEAAAAWSGGAGAHAVLITASAKTDAIVHNSAQMCRTHGRIVLVGVVGLNLRRSDFYEKEITFQVSCSYGPRRSRDDVKADGGPDSRDPVDWTVQDNFEAVLEMMASGRLNVDPLITHRFKFADAPEAYELIRKDPSALGVILQYSGEVEPDPVVEVRDFVGEAAGQPVVGVIGAGNFASAILLPALARTGVRLACVADTNGVLAQHASRKYGAGKAASDYHVILDDPAVNAVFIAVPHHLHARLVCEALRAGKHVHVEKPLCIAAPELDAIREALVGGGAESKVEGPKVEGRGAEGESASAGEGPCLLAVGFNRRFSAHAIRMRELVAGRSGPLCMTYTVNAGAVDAGHWIQDPERGGGRIIGEACHFVDLMVYLTGSRVTKVSAMMVEGGAPPEDDKMAIVLSFADGSVGTINYFANGTKRYPKERLEVFGDGRVLRLENWRVLRGWGFKGFRKFRTLRQDKGHQAEVAAFVARVRTGGPSASLRAGAPLIAFDDLANVTKATFAAVESARTGKVVEV